MRNVKFSSQTCCGFSLKCWRKSFTISFLDPFDVVSTFVAHPTNGCDYIKIIYGLIVSGHYVFGFKPFLGFPLSTCFCAFGCVFFSFVNLYIFCLVFRNLALISDILLRRRSRLYFLSVSRRSWILRLLLILAWMPHSVLLIYCKVVDLSKD